MSMAIHIKKLKMEHADFYFDQIAELHTNGIHYGALTLLGKTFLSQLYKEFTRVPKTGVWIAENNGNVLGFISGCADLKKTYIATFLSFKLIFLTLRTRVIFSPSFIKKLLAIILYPLNAIRLSTNRKNTEIYPELLSIVVSPKERRHNIGKLLVSHFERELKKWGLSGYYQVSTNLEEIASNAFYQSLGFEHYVIIKHHDLTLNIYRKHII